MQLVVGFQDLHGVRMRSQEDLQLDARPCKVLQSLTGCAALGKLINAFSILNSIAGSTRCGS